MPRPSEVADEFDSYAFDLGPWHRADDVLPDDGEIVLARLSPRCWSYGYGGAIKNITVVQFVSGKVPKPGESITWPDAHGNNRVPYGWSGDGPMRWKGLDVTHWARIGRGGGRGD